jgi:PadR family transcriptional regulator, regulatory protein PadR
MRRHLGEFEQLLLLALAGLESDASGTSVRRAIQERTGRVLSPGAIYTGFGRLERRGYVRSSFGDPTPERGGKRKRLYRLTPAGSAALRQAQTSLAQMTRGLRTTTTPR